MSFMPTFYITYFKSMDGQPINKQISISFNHIKISYIFQNNKIKVQDKAPPKIIGGDYISPKLKFKV